MRHARLVWILGLASLVAGGALQAASSSGQWSGTVAAVSGDNISLVGVADRFRIAGSITESSTGRSVPAQDVAPGTAVTLRVGPREADGRFRVDAAVVQPKNPLTLAGPITSVGLDGRSMSVLGVRVELDDHTAFLGRGASGLVRSARALSAGMTVEVALTATPAGSLQASRVRIAGRNGRSTRIAPRRPDDNGEDQEFKGTVVAITDSTWTIDEHTVTVDDQTVFIGNPGVGDFVEVRFHLDTDGTEIADRIQKEDAENDEFEFDGIVEAIGDTSWTISGHIVKINAATVIEGDPRVGDRVEVRADRAPDGTLTATRIHKEDPEDQRDEVEFRGVVESIGDTSWTIGGTVVLVGDATEIRDDPKVGDLVEVRADRASDGTLTATRIELEDSSGHGGGDDSGGGGND